MKREFDGLWYNQHGSKLELKVKPGGAIDGTFWSGAGLAAQERTGRPVSGYCAGDLVAFVCDFGKYGSLTTWTGHLVSERDAPVLEAQWQMAVALPARDRPEELWRGIWTGADVFRRAPTEAPAGAGRLPSHPLPEWP
jgi:hypothetical protein